MTHRVLEASCGPLLVDDDGLLLHARGIVYATAERFTAPILAPPHTHVHDATQRGAACPQLPSRLNFVTGPVIDQLRRSEACQVLSITAPSDADNLPVMVWFHGGAYMSGSGEAPKYDPNLLVAEGRVVVVRVTYRLGIFGYLNPCADGDENLGLRDQIAALRWVHQHIAAFGGDPSQVTIFGQSAGGDSVYSLILSADTTGLFHRAIIQSAPLGLLSGREPMTAAMRQAVADALGDVAPADASVETLLDAQTAAATAAQGFGLSGGLPYAPIAGLDPLPDTHRRLGDTAPHVEILVGYTRNDAGPFLAMNPHTRRLQRAGLARAAGAVMTRRIFGQPARELATTWTAHGGNAGTYRVDWSPPGAPLSACHCIELPLLFESECWADAPMLGPATNAIDRALARRVRGYWSAFAHDGIAGLGTSHLRV
ncbi:carboxylesterase family protein [Mycobacterium sp. EPa45]|uniref:carboxylesterase family protein n=1 Tax=Mycobacterium sp. EPa45 TaxID=1545728 RepID=UPI000641FB7F|nr:carboxylesterase family protein [Mycobacterium sp. EPa45]AKK30484.1 para-nitrobenzyl esterase [Mycobacterium sp. EPa45]